VAEDADLLFAGGANLAGPAGGEIVGGFGDADELGVSTGRANREEKYQDTPSGNPNDETRMANQVGMTNDEWN
jgi:hypothetical protein